MKNPTIIDQQYEMVAIDSIRPHERNVNEGNLDAIIESMKANGFYGAVRVQRSSGRIVAGTHTWRAAKACEFPEIPVIWMEISDEAALRIMLADNRTASLATINEDALAVLLDELLTDTGSLAGTGFSADDLDGLMAELAAASAPEKTIAAEEEAIPEPQSDPVSRAGDLWLIGRHRLICGDCRDLNVLAQLFDDAVANVVITSPPYASQREYDPTSGFKPVPVGEYVEWFRGVADGIKTVLADDGSYFLNIKAHADEGERSLYVMDLVMAHRRQWGWRFVDEFCWRKTDNGVPGGWQNRFKNAWEPVFHFCQQTQIKFRSDAVSHKSEDCFDYSPNNPKSTSGSGLLGTGARGAAADGGKNQNAWVTSRSSLDNLDGRHTGLARPSNVVEVKSESSQGSHSAPFPRALVEFFVKAFSDACDVIFDPFMGSGTTMAAAAVLDRSGYGCEISPAYCDVIIRRLTALTGETAVLSATGESFASVAESRGVSVGVAA